MKLHELADQYKRWGFWVIVVAVGVIVYQLLEPFFLALTLATMMSVLAYPLYAKLRKKFSETGSSLMTILGTLLAVGLPLFIVSLMVWFQMSSVISGIQNEKAGAPQKISFDVLVTKADEFVGPIMQQLGSKQTLAEMYAQNREEITRGASGVVTTFAKRVLNGTLEVVIAFVTMFFMLKDGHKLRRHFVALVPMPNDRAHRILDRSQATIHAVFMGVILVALIQGLLATLAYWVLGVDAWLVWGAVTTVLCAIPLLGAPVIYVPLGLILIIQGRIGQGIALLAWCFIVVSNVDNVLRPKYIGDRVGLSYLVTFFSLLGGVLLFGPIGLMGGPLVATISLELLDYVREICGAPKNEDAVVAS